MKSKLLVFLMAVLSSASFAYGQLGQQMALLNSPAYEAAAAPLRGAPPRQYNFSKAVLSDVMRLMAEDAGIGFFGLPDGSSGGDRLVTFTIKASPFVALETLAKANGVALIHDSGIWYLRPANDNELIGRIYEINYNAQELVTKNTQATSANGGASGSFGAGGGASAGLDLQGSPDFFVTEPSRILEDIQNILDIPTTGSRATIAPTASVDSVSQLSVGSFPGVADVVSRGANPAGAAEAAAGQSKVIWNSDSNTLYVVATRQQHQWIEAYLASADRPQPMIAVEVKFIETTRNPTSDFGIDWSGALGENGLEVGLQGATGDINLDSIGSYSLPTAVLSYSDLNWKLRAIYGDRNTKSVSFPRMVTLDNREVAFRSVINQPVLGSSASASLGAGGTQTSSVEYIPIGTVINILPKRMKDDKILLNVSVTVSDIVGTEFIDGNPFPIATSRVYTAPLTVKSGYTVAISGLDAASTEYNETGVPGLAKIPVLGYAFKNRRKDRNRQHLMMLITPISLGSGTEGLTKKPVIVEPWKKHPYSKQPVAEGAPRTNADLYQHPPVEEVPRFEEHVDPVTTRKASHEFGKKPALVAAPLDAEVSTLQVGANAVVAPAVAPEVAPQVAPAMALQTAEPIPTPRMSAEPTPPAPEPEISTVAAAPEEANEVVETPKPEMAPAPKPAAEEAPEPEPTASIAPEEQAPVVMDAKKLATIKGGISSIEGMLSKVPAGTGKLQADDAQLVVNAFEEAQKLLDEVDDVRGNDGAPLQGELGDAWWQLISLKTKAVKISRRSPESLALNLDGDSDEEPSE